MRDTRRQTSSTVPYGSRHHRTSTHPCCRARPLEWHHLIVIVTLLAPAHGARDVPAAPKTRRAEDLPGQRPGRRLRCRRRRLHECWRRTRRRRRWQTCSVEFTSYRSSSSRVARSPAPMESKLSSASALISKSRAREESTYTESEHLPDPVSRPRPEQVRAPWRRGHTPSTLMRCPLLAFSVAARLPPLASCCRSRSPLTHRLLHYSKVISSDFDGRVRRTCQPRRQIASQRRGRVTGNRRGGKKTGASGFGQF
jgi:hypothetical protein